ncbi:MAG: redoxin domain-containing protein [Cyclobacteriaceae bacterium]|nr:redoxin domain-containing protein [Cyclobacteriaceae bacterium]
MSVPVHKTVYVAIGRLAIVALLFINARPLHETETFQQMVPNFVLPDIQGHPVALSDFTKAKGFILVFMSPSCPFALSYETRVEGLNREFLPQGFPVLAISPNDPYQSAMDSKDEIKKRAIENGYSFPVLLDEGQKITSSFSVEKIPHVIVLGKKQHDTYFILYSGPIDDSPREASDADQQYVKEMVAAYLEGTGSPYPIQQRPFGCVIKWTQNK